MTYIDRRHVTKTVTFTGAAGNGAVGTVALFTCTGRVWIQKATAFCTVNLVGATATAQVGLALVANQIFGVITATDCVAGDWWVNTATSQLTVTYGETTTMGQPTGVPGLRAVDGNIILTVSTADITAGTVVFDIWYDPITPGASLVPA